MGILHLALHRIFLGRIQVPPKPKWQAALAQNGTIEPLPVERNGKRICCLLISKPEDSNTRGVALLLHPVTSYAKYFFARGELIQTYLALGYRVVVMDLNGFGESEFNDFRYWQDILAVTSEIKKRFPDSELVVHGFSFSGFYSIPAMQDMPPNTRIIVENIYDSFYGYFRQWPVTRFLTWVLESSGISWMREMNVKQALSKLSRQDLRLLFVACGQDSITPLDRMRELVKEVKVSHGFEVFDQAGHLGAIKSEPERYKQMIAQLVES